MKSKRRAKAAPTTVQTAFWDTSAIVPLCCLQAQSGQARQTARVYARQVVWWVSLVECMSSFYRLAREGHLTIRETRQALERVEYLRGRWAEVQPTEEVRRQAERLLRTHRLRAADALQLSAALVWCANHPRGRTFVGADNNLAEAAESEGFLVIRLI